VRDDVVWQTFFMTYTSAASNMFPKAAWAISRPHPPQPASSAYIFDNSVSRFFLNTPGDSTRSHQQIS
jgi:hypothetical protein